ncbi:sugar hydrolase [Mycobacterium spongiae]|uniref:Sugar hydrolase n=1 Tax=Mycobacterium spongiae TaxID=886343 RepID=A0A975PYU9_9MYCO|nr:sugar hydrolase [Mycobacterium spongiae]
MGEFVVGSQWDGGFVGSYTITNSGDTAVSGWQLEFDVPASESITSLWNGQIVESDTGYVVTPQSWTQTIEPGGSVTVGFQGTQGGAAWEPTNVVINGEPVTGGGDGGGSGSGGGDGGGSGSGGGDGGGSGSGSGSGSGGGDGGGSGSGSGGGAGEVPVGEFSPYIDVTLWPPPNYADLAAAGIDDATLAFIVSGAGGDPAWGGVYSLNDPFITSQIAEMQSLGIDPTISFGGANGVDLAYTAADATVLAAQLRLIVDTFGIHKFDFDVEGGMQANEPVLTRQAEAIAILQVEQAAAGGPPIEVSYTLPVLPTGLTPHGLGVLEIANDAGVDVTRVNIMAMNYGDYFSGSNPDIGGLAIQAAESLHGQLMAMDPSLSAEEAWAKVGVTPMIGINDVQSEVFTAEDAQQLVTFAQQKGIGELSMWSVARDATGQLGSVTPHGSGIEQDPFDFARIFDQFDESTGGGPMTDGPPGRW